MSVPQLNSSDEQIKIFSPVALPCGATLQNRLVKVALYEHLGDFCGGPPNAYHNSLYSKWAQSDWGMIITGNVQVSRRHLSAPRDIIIPEVITETSVKPFKALANAMHDGGKRPETLAIMQLSHSGRQSANIMGGRLPFEPPLAPSAIPINPGPGVLTTLIYKSMFQTPREMTLDDVEDLVVSFVRGAKVAMLSGFDGIQLHAAHGFLLAQFISPKTNRRTDDYAAHPDTALRLLERITKAIRAVVPKTFVVGVKINAADYVSEEYNENGSRNSHDALQHICAIASWGLVDFIEISGGDYETPTVASPSKKRRQVLYSVYSQRALQSLSSLSLPHPTPLILLTGGLQTPEQFYHALSAPHAHLLGVGRLSILLPNLPILVQR